MDADTGFHTLIFFVTFVVTIAVICAKMRIQDSKFSMILPICTADFFSGYRDPYILQDVR